MDGNPTKSYWNMDGNQTNLDGILTKYRTQQSFFAISFHFLGQFIFTPIPKGGGMVSNK